MTTCARKQKIPHGVPYTLHTSSQVSGTPLKKRDLESTSSWVSHVMSSVDAIGRCWQDLTQTGWETNTIEESSNQIEKIKRTNE